MGLEIQKRIEQYSQEFNGRVLRIVNKFYWRDIVKVNRARIIIKIN
jgi:hypothetical protein